MANSFAQNLKNAIVNDLQSLVSSGVLGSYVVDNYSKLNLADYNFPRFPSAVVSAVNVPSSDYEDTANNLREYQWLLLVVTTADNLPGNDPTYMEYLIDSVLNKFDQDVTLQGMAGGGAGAATLAPPGPVVATDVTYAGFYIMIKA